MFSSSRNDSSVKSPHAKLRERKASASGCLPQVTCWQLDTDVLVSCVKCQVLSFLQLKEGKEYWLETRIIQWSPWTKFGSARVLYKCRLSFSIYGSLWYPSHCHPHLYILFHNITLFYFATKPGLLDRALILFGCVFIFRSAVAHVPYRSRDCD